MSTPHTREHPTTKEALDEPRTIKENAIVAARLLLSTDAGARWGRIARRRMPGPRPEQVSLAPVWRRSLVRAKQVAAACGSAGFACGDDAVFVGEHDGLYPVAEVELHEDAADVALDGRFGYDESLRDLAV
jgi:hypothetical protein